MSLILDGTTGVPVTTVTGTLPVANGGTGVTTAIDYGFRNRIINGSMVIDQRNAGASVTPANVQYTLDRWNTQTTQTGKFSVQQNAGSVTPPVGFKNYLGVTSLSAYSIVATDAIGIDQPIEGYNVADLGFGTVNAKTVTLSFQVYSSLTGTFGGSLNNNGRSRSYPFSYSIPVANTWTTISVTIAGDTTGTWLTTNGIGLEVFFNLGTGSTYSGTAGAWNGSTQISPTGATSVVGTNGATFYITGVQLEKGSTATSFDYRPYGTELALCQRYYVTGTAFGGQTSTTSGTLFSPINMRTVPTTITISTTAYLENVGNITIAAVNTNNTTASILRQQYSNSAAGSGTAPIASTFTASAEL